jgi:hypothetical protein
MEPELSTALLMSYELRLQGLYDELESLGNGLLDITANFNQEVGPEYAQLFDRMDADAIRAEILGAKHRVHGALIEVSRIRGRKRGEGHDR